MSGPPMSAEMLVALWVVSSSAVALAVSSMAESMAVALLAGLSDLTLWELMKWVSMYWA